MPIEDLLNVMTRLRDRERGCPWDLEQTFATIAPYTIEEAYEVADAIARDDRPALRDELGDLLFQVVFHAQMAHEAGDFGFEEVVQSICSKMLRRHPHVFGDARIDTAEQQTRVWEAQKAEERAAAGPGASALDDVPLALPALTRAEKIGKRAASVGFDWPEWRGAREKIDEELRELDREIDAGNAQRIEQEFGDLLFALVNLGRHLRVDPENALRAANQRFTARFRSMERTASARGQGLRGLDLAQLEALWIEAKEREKGGSGA